MKRLLIVYMFFFLSMNGLWANQSRLNVLMTDDLVDDIVLIDRYPHHIAVYDNAFFGDLTTEITDFGITITPDAKYGVLAFWQNAQQEKGFNIGYALNLSKFDIGFSVSPIEDHYRYGFGIGHTGFNRRCDLSFIIYDDIAEQWYEGQFRVTRRKGDFVIVPRYGLLLAVDPDEYQTHSIALMVQRLVLSEGFVFIAGEYDFTRGGDDDIDISRFHLGFELPIYKKLVISLGIKETFTDGFEAPEWDIEPGLSLRLREFRVDLHMNKDWFFERNETFLHSIGLDLNFGRF